MAGRPIGWTTRRRQRRPPRLSLADPSWRCGGPSCNTATVDEDDPFPGGRRKPATVRVGAAIVQSLPGLEDFARIVLHHHEHFDGEGYPAGIAGEDVEGATDPAPERVDITPTTALGARSDLVIVLVTADHKKNWQCHVEGIGLYSRMDFASLNKRVVARADPLAAMRAAGERTLADRAPTDRTRAEGL